MGEQLVQSARYIVNITEQAAPDGVLFFTFEPKGAEQERGPRGAPKRAPQFVVAVGQGTTELTYDWNDTPDDPGPDREEIQAEIATRMEDRSIWNDRVTALVGQVEKWAGELNWATRRIEKNLDDAWIGPHKVPALLMQHETCRVLLEPIARSAPGTEGVVDLYLMPAYDDIAVLFYYSDRWNIHYNMYRGTNAVVPAREADAMPLSKETLEKVLNLLRR